MYHSVLDNKSMNYLKFVMASYEILSSLCVYVQLCLFCMLAYINALRDYVYARVSTSNARVIGLLETPVLKLLSGSHIGRHACR